MQIESLKFAEYKDQAREWSLEDSSFGAVNLIVGKNASGKSRLLNVMSGLAKMLRGEMSKVYHDGEYVVHFRDTQSTYRYEIAVSESAVTREVFTVDNEKLLARGANGIGKIWSAGIKQHIDFEAPPNLLAAQVRRDSIQHPYFESMHAWAQTLRHIQFGTPLGRDKVYLFAERSPSSDKESEVTDPSQVSKLYQQAFEEFGEAFDKAVLRDFESLGYECTAVGLESAPPELIQGPPIALLFVQEKDLRTKTYQLHMSQGMFRALSLVIQLNYWMLRKRPRTILIDDIGEGLDFRRAQAFIALIIDRALENGIQLVMTSNDRFVMNGVPLKYWGVLTRERHSVRIANIRNSAKIFDEFEELGLNNFDFFSTNFFEEGRK